MLRDLCVATVDLELKRVRLIMDDVEGAIADRASGLAHGAFSRQ